MAIDITNQSKQVATSKHAYSDLDLLFRKHPQTGDRKSEKKNLVFFCVSCNI